MLNETQRKIVETLQESINIDVSDFGKLKVTQTPGYTDSSLQIPDFAVGIMATLGLVIERFANMRGLENSSIGIDRRHSQLMFNSVFYHYHNGWAVSMEDTKVDINSFYPTRDGRWVNFNGAYPKIRKGLLEYLNSPHSKTAIRASTMLRKSSQIESDLAELNLCGVIYRSPEEWLDHPQGAFLHGIQPIHTTKVGQSFKKVPKAHGRPLEGIRVLDLTRVVAGPNLGRQLAEQGADVIHIRHPYLDSIYCVAIESSYGKKNIFLDYKNDSDRKIFESLISEADLLVCGYRRDALDKAGFTRARLQELNGDLITVRLNAYGPGGPWSGLRGWEQLAQTCTGAAYLHTESNDYPEPHLIPALVNDYGTGYLGSIGAIASLIKRQNGEGIHDVDVCLAKTSMFLTEFNNNRDPAEPLSSKDLKAYMVDQETPNGVFTRVSPPVAFDRTPSYAYRPNSIIGSTPPDIGWDSEEDIQKSLAAAVPHYPSRLAADDLLRGVELGFGIEDKGKD